MRIARLTVTVSVLVAIALLTSAHSASAAVIRLSLEQLTLEADRIVVATVTTLHSRLEDDGLIRTYVTLQVDEYLKGDEVHRELTVKILGGTVDDLGLKVSDSPKFELGEEVLVFLEEEDGSYRVFGHFQGKHTIRDDRVLERRIALPAFRRRIHQILSDQAKPPTWWRNLRHYLRRLTGPSGDDYWPIQSTSPTPTFVYNGMKWGGSNPMEPPYRINPANNNGVSAASVLAVVQSAAATWSEVSTADFEFTYGGTTTATDSSLNGANEILWKDGGYSTALATAYWWYNTTSGSIVEADIVFNDYHFWSTSGGGYDIETVTLHELGHWLSLGHDSNPDAVMYYAYGGVRRSLHASDAAGISYIYPSDSPSDPTTTPTITPTITSTPTPMSTPTSPSTPIASPTATPTASPTATPTLTPVSTSASTSTPIATLTPTPTRTGSPQAATVYLPVILR